LAYANLKPKLADIEISEFVHTFHEVPDLLFQAGAMSQFLQIFSAPKVLFHIFQFLAGSVPCCRG
jgi:hypothetical protein